MLRRLRSIHGHCDQKVQSYFCVTKPKPTKSAESKCWEHRGLDKVDLKKIRDGDFKHEEREFSKYLNEWGQIEEKLK